MPHNRPFPHKLVRAASDNLKTNITGIRLLQQCLKPYNSITSYILHVFCKWESLATCIGGL